MVISDRSSISPFRRQSATHALFLRLWEAMIRILLVEDNPELSRRLTEGLRNAGFVVEHAAEGALGYELGRSEDFDASFSTRTARHAGCGCAQALAKEGRQMPVLILTARGSWTERSKALTQAPTTTSPNRPTSRRLPRGYVH